MSVISLVNVDGFVGDYFPLMWSIHQGCHVVNPFLFFANHPCTTWYNGGGMGSTPFFLSLSLYYLSLSPCLMLTLEIIFNSNYRELACHWEEPIMDITKCSSVEALGDIWLLDEVWANTTLVVLILLIVMAIVLGPTMIVSTIVLVVLSINSVFPTLAGTFRVLMDEMDKIG